MYTLEELKAAADRLRTTGNTYLGKTLYEGEGRKVVVLQGFRGSMDRGLAYLVKETVDGERPSPCASIYYLDGLQTGASADLEDYIHKVLPAQVSHWVSQREAREREAREAAQEAERQRFHGFTDGMSPMGKGKVVKILSKRYRYDEGIMTRAERVERMVAVGGHLSTWTNSRGNTEYRIHYQNEWFYTVTKTEYEYFQYLKSR
nr:MAG TPA: hypothetical protein [Bacteriophage sp.]